MNKELLPCPFCGNSDAKTADYAVRTNGAWEVQCGNVMCHARKPSEGEAIAAWNSRATPRVRLNWRGSRLDGDPYKERSFVAVVQGFDLRFVAARESHRWHAERIYCDGFHRILGDALGYDTADEAKAACEEYAQRLVEELTR